MIEKKYKQAIKHFDLALKDNPEDTDAYNYRGSAYEKLSEFSKAMNDFNKVIEIDPKNSMAHYNRGVIYGRQSKFDQALQEYTIAITLNPLCEWAYYNRSRIYEKLLKYNAAIQDLEKIIEINPNFALAYNNLGWVYATCKDKRIRNGASAVSFASKAVKFKKDGRNLDTLAAAYIENQQYQKALETYKSAIQTDSSVIVHYQKSLNKKGLYSGPIDGISNQNFENAIQECITNGNHL